MPSAAVKPANVTQCNSPAVLRQVKYELRVQCVEENSCIQTCYWNCAFSVRIGCRERAGEPFGYLQAIGDRPFFCTFDLREQLELFVNLCKSDPATVHFDARGTVIKDIPDNKRVLCYCMIPSDCTVPVFEFLSSQHTTETLAHLLELFSRDVRILNNGTTVKPQYLVIDFSYAILNAVLQALNKCTITRYLRTTLQILKRKKTTSSIHQPTIICLCMAHTLKCLSRTLM